jgi:hypothetical protein
MIETYIKKLIKNLPQKDGINIPQRIDLVLDGGIFNGSYLVGALYFLKEMEKKNYIIIERISGCSIGSITGLLYLIDSLDIVEQLYIHLLNCLKKNYNLSMIKDLKIYLKDCITEDICDKVNHKLYINYNNISDNKKHVKKVYKDVDELIDTIIKSCYIPFFIDNNLLYKEKYIDGLNPYIFEKEHGKKILFIDLYGFDKIFQTLNVKNEKTNFHRILSGLLDIHTFYIKQSNTYMCSYVDEWNIINRFLYSIKLCIEKIIIYLVISIVFIQKYIPDEWKRNILYKIIVKICQDIFIILFENYCL